MCGISSGGTVFITGNVCAQILLGIYSFMTEYDTIIIIPQKQDNSYRK